MTGRIKYLPVPLILVLLFGCLPYLNTFDNPFVFDDADSITDNPVIKNLSGFLPGEAGWAKHPTRVVGYLSFALNYRIGSLDVFGYHAVNLAIHAANSLLVYAIAFLLLKTPGIRRVSAYPAGISVPLIAALLFAAHPVQTGAVTYVVQRLASLATLFYLGSTAAYIKARLVMEEDAAAERRPIRWFLVAWGCALLAVKTKEVAFTLPAVVLLAEGMFFEGSWRKRLPPVLPFFLIALIIPVTLIRLDQPLEKVLADSADASRLQTELSRSSYLFTQFRVIATYLRLLVLPVNLNLDYDYPIRTALFDPPVLLSLLLILALLGLAWLFLASPSCRTHPELRLSSFGILWFFITLSVESSVLPIRDVIFEHRLYLPSTGAFLAAASISDFFWKRIPLKRKDALAAILAGIVVFSLSLGTYARNRVWQDEITLWEDVVRKSSGKARPRYNLGLAYSKRGRTDEAIAQYLQSIRLRPDYPEAWDNLGLDYARRGRLAEAVQAHETASRIDPSYAAPYYNIGRIYMTSFPERAADARSLFRKALDLRPDYVDAWINLAGACIRLGAYPDAARAGERAIALAPERSDGHFNLAVALFLTGDRQGANRELSAVKALDAGMGSALERFFANPPR